MSSFFALDWSPIKRRFGTKRISVFGNAENWNGASGSQEREPGLLKRVELISAVPRWRGEHSALFFLAFPLARQRSQMFGCGLLLCLPARDFRGAGRLPDRGPATTGRDNALAIRGKA